ncbi:MAG TPA: phospholipid carrier-dependent glycosyltransferase, partial [Geobacteraceae bacterium]
SAFSRSMDTIDQGIRTGGYLLAAGLALFGAGCLVYPFVAPSPEFSLTACIVVGCILLGEGIMTFVNLRRRSLLGLVTGIVICSYAFGIVSPALVLARMADRKSVKELGVIVREKAKKEDMVASLGLVQGLSFYAKRRVVVVGFRGEVDFGSRQGDNTAWFYDFSAFLRVWESRRTVYFLLMDEVYNGLKGSSMRPSPRMVARSGDFVLVTNR